VEKTKIGGKTVDLIIAEKLTRPRFPTKPTTNMTEENKNSGKGLIAAGYICGGLALLILPIPLGLAGFAIGVVNLTKGRTGHGVAQMIISAACGLIGALLGAAIGAAAAGG
jgi:hypothetical protein